jgi:hypothetical protein
VIDIVLLWLAAFGVWPIADPGHEGSTLLSNLDIAIHIGATFALCRRWRIVRRTSQTTNTP